jgi:hypothetical protein
MTESILNNESCFLTEENWQPVFKSLVIKTSLIGDRSHIVVELTGYLGRMSVLFKEVTSLICGKTDRTLDLISQLICQAQNFWATIKSWNMRYNCLFRLAQETSPDDIVNSTYWATMGIYLACTIISARLLGAVSGSQVRVELEQQCQQMADEIIHIEGRESVVSCELSLSLAQKVRIAQATKTTAMEWTEMTIPEDEEYGSDLIEKWRFVHWCQLFDRKTT